MRAIAPAVALVVAALAAAPARADTVGTVPSPPAGAGDTTVPFDSSQPTPTSPQGNTAISTQTATATGGGGGSATGGTAGPAQGSSHAGDAYANGGRAEGHNSLDNGQSDRYSGADSSGGDGKFESKGRDTYMVEGTKRRAARRATGRAHQTRSRSVESRTADHVIRRAANQHGGRQTGKAPPRDGRVPGHDRQLPSQNPFFSLMSGSGGAGTGLLLLLLAVLAASITLPNQRLNAMRTPTVAWRPSAYVSPIELPG